MPKSSYDVLIDVSLLDLEMDFPENHLMIASAPWRTNKMGCPRHVDDRFISPHNMCSALRRETRFGKLEISGFSSLKLFRGVRNRHKCRNKISDRAGYRQTLIKFAKHFKTSTFEIFGVSHFTYRRRVKQKADVFSKVIWGDLVCTGH